MGKNSARNNGSVRGGCIEKFIILSFIIFRIILFASAWIAGIVILPKLTFLSDNMWANFDGEHYLKIAQYGYSQFQQAFFPLFPLLIHVTGSLFGGNYMFGALFIVHISLLLSLFLLWKLVHLDFDVNTAYWTILFFLFFPTSFFLASAYSESLFILLTLGSFYAARKQHWFIASVLGGFATATRFVGIAILPALLIEWLRAPAKNPKHIFSLALIPSGLVVYMIYLQQQLHDSLAFIHTQSAFGVQRSGGEIILLPQVLFRYAKIFLTVSFTSYNFWIAAFEFMLFLFAAAVLLRFFKQIRPSYLFFAFATIIVPTLTGSLSSFPRYMLVSFPFFISLALIRSQKIKVVFLAVSVFLLNLLTALFTQGYWVA